jgi:hypothetical protein
MPPTVPVSLRLAPELVDWLTARAAEDERSRAFIISKMIKAEMARLGTAAPKSPRRKARRVP